MRWSPSGNRIATATKIGQMVVVDPRTQGTIQQNQKIHIGMKASKLAWVDEQYIVTSGFDKGAQREYGVWDSRDLS